MQMDIKGHPILNSIFPQCKPTQSCIRLTWVFGGSQAKAMWADVDIAVCTIGKANSLVNAAIEDGKSNQLGIVAMDEFHMFDDENRCYLIELTITRLLCLQQGTQLIGMSATLSGSQPIADWLGAKFYVSKYRPVPID
jgi:replicative superfamily II helicase